jgi:hypothetical protein
MADRCPGLVQAAMVTDRWSVRKALLGSHGESCMKFSGSGKGRSKLGHMANEPTGVRMMMGWSCLGCHGKLESFLERGPVPVLLMRLHAHLEFPHLQLLEVSQMRPNLKSGSTRPRIATEGALATGRSTTI